MSKKDRISSNKKTTTTKSTNTKKSVNKQIENEVIVEELKNTAKNVKKEFTKAKNIIVKGIKSNTNNIPNEVKDIKEKFSKKIVETKDKIIDEINNKTKESKSTEKSKNSNSNNKQNNKKLEKYQDKLSDVLLFLKKKINSFIDYIKKMDRKKLIIILVVIFAIIFVIPSIFNKEKKYRYDYDYVEELVIKYKVKLNIDFEENLLFSKYDVSVSSSGQYETLKHGEDKILEFYLEEGEHTLIFKNDEDSSISKEIVVNVTSNMEVGFKVSCHYDKIFVTKKYTDIDVELVSNEIKIDADKSAFIYKNYKDVIKKLENLGFTNIEEKPMYDIELGWTDEGEVESVKIDGKDNYKRGDIFNSDVKVVVSYHLNANDDPSKNKAPYDSSSASGIKYEDVVKAFKDAGFTNVLAVESANYSNKTEKTVSSITADGSSISIDKVYKPNVKIEIKYYGNPKDYDSKEDEKLSLYYAKKAFEKYGESQYRYGFKCHWILNNIASEQSEDGKTWYFKVGVTIENAYGNKYDAIAEGKVTGNDYSQKVTNFYVN
ncbi:MAG: hypothetical protein IJA94_04235 [Bacilli bacterium]|nr:hypothetical protein [Bacilli bacterium]